MTARVDMTKDELVTAIQGVVAAGIDEYVHMRFKEGFGHQASKDHAVDEAREAASGWIEILDNDSRVKAGRPRRDEW